MSLDVAIDASERRRAVPADALLHAVALAAIGVLLLNDQVLKDVAPGLVTGKLSDVAGAFATALGAAQWAIGLTLTGGHGSSEMVPTLVVQDPTDLVALPAVLIAAWIGASRLQRSEARR